MVTEFIRIALTMTTGVLLLYFFAFTVVYTTLMIISVCVVKRQLARSAAVNNDTIHNMPVMPPVALLVPAYNEEVCIVETVHSLLNLNYPAKEIIVIDDGSNDRTLSKLIEQFGLRPISMVYRQSVEAITPEQFYWSDRYPELTVVHKANGGKPDALNVGLNMARSPYFCTVDADTIVDIDGLRHLMAPIVESREEVIVSTGAVRVLNGSAVQNSRVIDRKLPNTWIEMCQVIEYIRSFLFGRPAWTAMNGMLVCSGAFCLIERNRAVEVGGFSGSTLTEDTELIARLHHHLNAPIKMAYTPYPVCWTQAPKNLSDLGKQRRRWHLGMIQTVIKHDKAILNPKCGFFGFVSLPFHAFMEGFGAALEFTGAVLVIFAVALRLVSWECFFLFLALSVGYGTMVSIAAILLQDRTPHNYLRPTDVCKLMLFALIENLGYRQIAAWFKCQAIVQAFFRSELRWEKAERFAITS